MRLLNGLLSSVSLVQRRHERARLAQLASAQRALVLSFDDGPTERMTSAMLDLLSGTGACATFFMVGNKALREPELVARVSQEGHEIGAHSMRHGHAMKVGARRATTDYHDGLAALASLGVEPRLFRPPYGRVLSMTRRACKRDGVELAWWTHDSGDSDTPLPRLEPTLTSVASAGGGVVLMHDLDRPTPETRKREAYVLRATELLLRLAEDESMELMTLGTLLERARGGARL